MSPPRETWFDRISAPHTRRQSLKAAAAGAAAAVGATLPFAGKLPEAGAATPTDCRKGCVYMVNKRFAQESAIDATYFGTSAYIASKGLGPFYGIFSSLFYLGGRLAVADQRWARQRQELPACFQPLLPGLQPESPRGSVRRMRTTALLQPLRAGRFRLHLLHLRTRRLPR